MNKKYTISCLFLVSFSILFAMEAPRLNPRVAAEQLLRRVREGQDLQLDSYSIKDLQNINQYLKRESESNELAGRVYWEIDEEIGTRSPISAPVQEEIDRDLQDTVNEMLGKIARNREINFEDFDANRLGQIREYVRKNRHLEGANILDFQITFYLDPARLETTAHDLIAKQMRQQPLNLGQFSNQELYTLSQYLKLKIDLGEKGPIKGVYTLINNYLAGESVIPISQPTPRPITPTPGPIRPAPRPIQPVPQPPYQPIGQLPRPQAKAPFDEEIIQFWQEWFNKGQLNLPGTPIDSLLNALAGIETHNLQKKYMRLYDELKAEFERRSGAQPVIPMPRPTPPIRPPVREEEVEEKAPARRTVHLIDTNRLNQLGLCPLFQDLDDEAIATMELLGQKIDRGTACYKKLTSDETFIQLNTINQFRLDAIGYATCPVQSLRSISLIVRYALSGEKKYLDLVNNLDEATRFVKNIQNKVPEVAQWATADELQKFLQDIGNNLQLRKQLGLNDIPEILVIGSVTELQPDFMDDVLKRKIGELRKQWRENNTVIQGFVIGTGAKAQHTGERIHFFALIMIKKANEKQYIIVDTAPGAYRLSGYNFEEIRYAIDMITKGYSNIDLNRIIMEQQ